MFELDSDDEDEKKDLSQTLKATKRNTELPLIKPKASPIMLQKLGDMLVNKKKNKKALMSSLSSFLSGLESNVIGDISRMRDDLEKHDQAEQLKIAMENLHSKIQLGIKNKTK